MPNVIGEAFIAVHATGDTLAADVSKSLAPVEKTAVATGTKVAEGISGKNVSAKVRANLGQVGGAFESLGSKIGGVTGEVFNKAGEALQNISEKASGAARGMQIAGAGLAGIGGALAFEGSKEKAAAQQLEAAFQSVGASTDDYSKQIEEAVKHQENYGHSAAETKTALGTLTLALHDPTKALNDMQVVADVAAQKHISLNDAATLVARTANGNTRILKQYGIDLTGIKNPADKGRVAIEQLSKIVAGQASASTNTFTGHLEALKTKAEDAFAGFGAKYGTAVLATGSAIGVVGTVAESEIAGKVVKSVAAGAAAVGELAASAVSAGVEFGAQAASVVAATAATVANTVATTASSVATKAWAVAQAALNIVMDANPIVLVGVAIAALVAAIIVAYEKSQTFRDIVLDVMRAVGAALHEVGAAFASVGHAISAVVGAVVGFIEDHWKLLVAIMTGPIGAIAIFVVSHFDDIRNIVTTVIGDVESVITSTLTRIRTFWGDVWSGFSHTVSTVWSGISAIVRGAINDIIGGVNFFIRAIDAIQIHIPSIGVGPFHTPGFDWGGLKIPQIPYLASGGTFSGLAIAGEFGPELIAGQGRVFSRSDTTRMLGSPITIHKGAFQVIVQGHADDDVLDRAGDRLLDGLTTALRGRGWRPA